MGHRWGTAILEDVLGVSNRRGGGEGPAVWPGTSAHPLLKHTQPNLQAFSDDLIALQGQQKRQ